MDLAECLELLRSSSTEKKLVGLLLVCKFIPAPESDPLVLRQICEAIGFEFLNRLLNTTGSISGSVSFRGLALSVLSTFSLDAELVGQEGFIKAIPFFVAALDSSDPQEALDALRCLVGAAENCVAIEKLLACGVCRHVALSLSHNDAATPSTAERLALKFHLFDKLCGATLDRGRITLEEQGEIFAHLAKLFRENQQELKFSILERLITFLSHCDDTYAIGMAKRQKAHRKESKEVQPGETGALENLRVGLFHILASKVAQHQRDLALTLGSICLQRFGEEWAVGFLPPIKEASEERENGNGGRLAELLISLAGVEISMSLHRNTGIVEKEADERVARIISVCYGIIEQTINFLSAEDPDDEEDSRMIANDNKWLHLPHESLEHIQKHVREVFECIVEYLKDAASGERVPSDANILLATTRILGVWLGQETLALQQDIISLLPFLLSIREGFAFLLPGFLHLTSEPEGRSAFLRANGCALLLAFLDKVVHTQEIPAGPPDGVLLDTCLGVLLNMVCLDPDMVAGDIKSYLVFLPILQEIALLPTHLIDPEDPAQLSVLTNVLVASLFILRLTSEATMKEAVSIVPAFSLAKFFDILAHILEKVSGAIYPKNQTEARPRSDLTELFLMAAHGLTDSLQRFPMLSEAMKRSSWQYCAEATNLSDQDRQIFKALRALVNPGIDD